MGRSCGWAQSAGEQHPLCVLSWVFKLSQGLLNSSAVCSSLSRHHLGVQGAVQHGSVWEVIAKMRSSKESPALFFSPFWWGALQGWSCLPLVPSQGVWSSSVSPSAAQCPSPLPSSPWPYGPHSFQFLLGLPCREPWGCIFGEQRSLSPCPGMSCSSWGCCSGGHGVDNDSQLKSGISTFCGHCQVAQNWCPEGHSAPD